jgi:hypothetical protein
MAAARAAGRCKAGSSSRQGSHRVVKKCRKTTCLCSFCRSRGLRQVGSRQGRLDLSLRPTQVRRSRIGAGGQPATRPHDAVPSRRNTVSSSISNVIHVYSLFARQKEYVVLKKHRSTAAYKRYLKAIAIGESYMQEPLYLKLFGSARQPGSPAACPPLADRRRGPLPSQLVTPILFDSFLNRP